MPTEIETDTDNTQPWTTIETASENGQAYKRTTTFDNGVVEVRNYGFFDGDLYRITTTDSPSENLYSWDTQVLNGNIVLGAFDIFEEIQSSMIGPHLSALNMIPVGLPTGTITPAPIF